MDDGSSKDQTAAYKNKAPWQRGGDTRTVELAKVHDEEGERGVWPGSPSRRMRLRALHG